MQVIADNRNHGRDQLRGILVIRMDHDDDVRASFEREPVAGLLISTVSFIDVVHMHLDSAEAAGYSDAQLVDISLAFATTVFTNVFNRINDTEIDFPAVA